MMMKKGRSWLIAVALLAMGASVIIPAGWSIYTLSNVGVSVTEIEQRNVELTAVRTLIDELAAIDWSLMPVLNGVTVGDTERAEIDRSIRVMTGFGSPLDRVMGLSARSIAPDSKVKLRDAADAVGRAWADYTKSDPANLQPVVKDALFLQISQGMSSIQKI
ncbi:MAG: hypothetical protein ACXWKH_19690, partial [Limisphaerales bacterium]